MDAILFDLDSTIADTLHRQWMVPLIKAGGEGAPTWDDYSLACADDKPIESTIALMRTLARTHIIYIVTGRSDAARDLTENWLWEHGVPYAYVYMRPAGDRTPNGAYKVRIIKHLYAFHVNPILFVEDYPEAADYIEKHAGIPVLRVLGNYNPPAENENAGSV